MNFLFFTRNSALGLGLAMDAFSVSLANGLCEPNIKRKKICLIAGVFAFFQFLMPMLGWICVHTVLKYFEVFEKAIPFIALGLLLFIGIKMIIDGVKPKQEEKCGIGFRGLIIQGIATSIDALSVGFTIATYTFLHAFVACLVIGVVTFIACFIGVIIGKRFGTKISGKANIFGGIILIIIGLEIFLTGIL